MTDWRWDYNTEDPTHHTMGLPLVWSRRSRGWQQNSRPWGMTPYG